MNKNKKFDIRWLKGREEYFKNLYFEIKKLKEKKVFENKRIAIVGVWGNAYEVREIIEKLGLSISIIADNNEQKQNVSRVGIISQSVESLAEEKDIVILVINNFCWQEFEIQLSGLGLKKDKDFFVLFGGRRNTRNELKKAKQGIIFQGKNWRNIRKLISKGYKSYIKIDEKYGHIPIWLMHPTSIGDLYIFACLLPHKMGVKSVAECDCVLVVTKNSVKRLAEALGFKHIELITFEDAHINWLTMLKAMGDKINVRNAVYHGECNFYVTMYEHSNINFRDTFDYVFEFEKKMEPIYPTFPKRTEYVRELFEKYDLIPGKTVLVSPYAGHFSIDLQEENWNYFVKKLQDMGFTVCTNCGGPGEPPLDNTAAPFIEIQDCVEFAETAGYFVGVRSGFCDLLCNADCKKIVLYETGSVTGSIETFGFENMGLGKNMIELVNDCNHKDEFMDEILEKLVEEK